MCVRGNGEQMLTPEGETVLRYVRRMKALEKKMAEELQEAGRRLTRLRIGITHTAESSIVAEVLARYTNENPGISITIVTDNINNLYDMLENFELDLAVVEGRLQIRDWTARDGNKRRSAEVLAESVYLGDSKRDGYGQQSGQQQPSQASYQDAPGYDSAYVSDFAQIEDDDSDLPF